MIKTFTKKGKLNKRSKRYRELHKLWLDTEEFLSYNKFEPIKKINPTFYRFLVDNNFKDDWDCWSICERYIMGKAYRPNIRFKIVKYADAFAVKMVDDDKIISIRNTKKQCREVVRYLEAK